MIILTSAQADHVRGDTENGARLMPIPLVGGILFVLPEAVLRDPAHDMYHEFLSALPTRGVAPNEWPVIED